MDDEQTSEKPSSTGGLHATELASVVAELRDRLRGARVRDLVILRGADDLVLFLEGEQRSALHVATGAGRARVCTTGQRFPKSSFRTGPQVDRLRGALSGASVVDIEQAEGERRCGLRFTGTSGELRLEVELFGNRGLWCLLDGEGRILELSRKARRMEPGGAYAPPEARRQAPTASSRFAPPVLDAVDAHFTDLDRAAGEAEEKGKLERILATARRKLENRLEGLKRQREMIGQVTELRSKADLMLAHAHGVERGAGEMTVPDPDRPGRVLRFELDPATTVVAQAEALYKRARKLEDGQAMAARRRSETEAELEHLGGLHDELETGAISPEGIRERLKSFGKPVASRSRERRKKKPAGHGFRSYTSLEGHPILVGRNNAQNDRLSVQVARGNDLWFHVGGGRAGSHVVVRLPRGKTASLETLLDAGTLAIHFSRSRGVPLCEVVYTHAKHVKKPKGLPLGKVLASQTKTLSVRWDSARLERLLGSAEH